MFFVAEQSDNDDDTFGVINGLSFISKLLRWFHSIFILTIFFFCYFVSTTIFFFNHWTHWKNDNKENPTMILTWSTFVSFYLSSWPLMCNVCLFCLVVCLLVCVLLVCEMDWNEFSMWFYCVSNVLCDACQTHYVHHIVHISVYAGAEMSLFMSERIRPNDK